MFNSRGSVTCTSSIAIPTTTAPSSLVQFLKFSQRSFTNITHLIIIKSTVFRLKSILPSLQKCIYNLVPTYCSLFFETGSHCLVQATLEVTAIAQAGFEPLAILQSQSSARCRVPGWMCPLPSHFLGCSHPSLLSCYILSHSHLIFSGPFSLFFRNLLKCVRSNVIREKASDYF